MSKPKAGKPYPEAWPHRMVVQGDVVHAIRRQWFAGQQELWSACREHMASASGAFWMYWKRRPAGTQVTCKACGARLSRPLTRSEVFAFTGEAE